jgi:hypothetical protein
MRNGILAVALFLCGACGGGSSTAASVDGNLAGLPMGAQDAVSNIINFSTTDSEGAILITNAPGTCAKLAANQQPKNIKAIQVGMGTQSASAITAPAASGVYTVHGSSTIRTATGNVAVALYVATDANCNVVTQIEATSGTITLTRADATGLSATFDITFSDASHVTGSFAANRCTSLTPSAQGICT